MKLFLDTSVILSASASDKGASRYIFENAKPLGCELVSSSYCFTETVKNLPKVGHHAAEIFSTLIQPKLAWVGDVVSSEYIIIFPKAKDRPVVLTALACEAHALLTLDRQDFMGLLGSQIYGMSILTPGDWLLDCREKGIIGS